MPIKIFGAACTLIAGLAMIRGHALWGWWIACTFAVVLLFGPDIDRYLLQALPLLFIACWEALRWLNRKIPRPWGNLLFAGLLTVCVTLNGIQFVTIICRQQHRPFLQFYKQGRFPKYIEMADDISKLPADSVILCQPKYGRIFDIFERSSGGRGIRNLGTGPAPRYVVRGV